MTISGITTTTDNGVNRITNDQNITGTGTIDGETIVLDGSSSYLESSSSGSVTVTNSQVKLDSDTPTGNDATAVINYGGRAITTTTMKFVDSAILTAGLSSRHNIMVTWLEDVTIIESGNSHNLFCYTATNAHVENVLFRGIKVWEVYRAPSVAFNIKVSNVGFGYLNWEAGRLDFFGFATEDISSGHFWHGTGNSGNNYSYHWNPNTSVDFEKLYLTSSNNRVYVGYTATWEFRDLLSDAKLSDVYLIFKDNRTGTTATKGSFTTDTNGHLKGTYDSQNDTTGSDIVRPTLFVLQKQVVNVDTGHPGAYDYPVVTITGDQGDRQKNYDVDTVTAYIEIRSYKHLAVTGFEPGDTFSISEEVGTIAADKTVDSYSLKYLTPDTGVTVTKTVALAYTKLDTLDKLYDRCKAEWRDNNDYPLVVPNGYKLDLDDVDIKIDGGSGSAYSYSSSTITISCDDTLVTGSKFTTVKTTGDMTIQGDAVIDGLSFDGDVYLNNATDLTDVTVTGDLHINTGAASTLEFDNVTVSGSVYNDDTAHTLIINSVNGSSVTAGDAGTGNGQTDIRHPVTVKVIVKDLTTKSAIGDARVLLDAGSGGDLPFEASVTITRSSSTATVSHTAHGFVTGDSVVIKGADQGEYVGYKEITVVDANSYTYTVTGTPTTPATGTITATANILNDLTDASGEAETTFNYTNDQPITGRVRKYVL
jgi:DNA/RNA endonuclease YhcR with UshA esterase domain